MATAPVDELEHRARALAGDGWEVAGTTSVSGGGTLPGVEITSCGLVHRGDVTTALRNLDPPVIARVDGGRTILDLRTVDPADDATLARALRAVG